MSACIHFTLVINTLHIPAISYTEISNLNPVNKPHSPKVNPSVFATGLCHRELYREKVVRRLLTQHNRHLRREQQQKNKLIIE